MDRIENFIRAWQYRGSEVANKATYWNALLAILGIPQNTIDAGTYIDYEMPVNNPRKHFHGAIDAYVSATKVLIEQKSNGVDLAKSEDRPNGSHHEKITPLAQAIRYNNNLSRSKKAKVIILCNFAEIWIYNAKKRNITQPIKIRLEALRSSLYVLHNVLIAAKPALSPPVANLAITSKTDPVKLTQQLKPAELSLETVNLAVKRFFFKYNQQMNKIEAMPDHQQAVHLAKQLQNQLANLHFLDVACGSGSFLVASYQYLRQLENRALAVIYQQLSFDFSDRPGEHYVKVNLSQFCGIDTDQHNINIARTCLNLANQQMLRQTNKIINRKYVPYEYANGLVAANPLQTDWTELLRNSSNKPIDMHDVCLIGQVLNKALLKKINDFANQQGTKTMLITTM